MIVPSTPPSDNTAEKEGNAANGSFGEGDIPIDPLFTPKEVRFVGLAIDSSANSASPAIISTSAASSMRSLVLGSPGDHNAPSFVPNTKGGTAETGVEPSYESGTGDNDVA